MDSQPDDDLPDDIEALKAALISARSDLPVARAQVSDDQALIAHLKFLIAKYNREKFRTRTYSSQGSLLSGMSQVQVLLGSPA